ncbi:hypothetical protein [Synoicihabitans lomoniglobus]|uniref:Cyclic nucleotide-binding domain-containing protein n=1 Tax=Synoicihabitans lomoniglobus TaxID=2909285 RepID=A0AAE9ZWR8_9BACT|nr:hypothetical protein [Opitutaceae bacterium LMO-M01]WED65701.1 hypothetical protein PXH66_02425 [Opitutaceae bacterium LMO-M01]
MTPVELMFALRRQPPFDSMSDGELEIAAKVVVERSFAPGALVLGPGEPFRRLLLRLDGSWQTDSRSLPTILGVESLLTGIEGPGEVRAGPDGVRCLTMTRGHFFTLVNECPALLLSLLSMADEPPETRPFL